MDLRFSEEYEDFRAEVRAFLAESWLRNAEGAEPEPMGRRSRFLRPSERQARFVYAYLSHCPPYLYNAGRSALWAGYCPTSPRQAGSQVIHGRKVGDVIERLCWHYDAIDTGLGAVDGHRRLYTEADLDDLILQARGQRRRKA